MRNCILAILILIVSIVPAYSSYYSDGCANYIRKNYDKARESFLAAVVENPSDGNSYYFLGEIEKLQENYSAAVGYYSKAVSTKKINPKYQKMAYWNIKVLSNHNTDYKTIIRMNKNVWDKTGDRAAKESVDNIINKLIWSNDEAAISHYNSGLEYKKNGNMSGALTEFSKALREDNTFLAAKFETGLIMFKQGNSVGAISNFRDIAEKIPFYGEVHILLGKIYYSIQNYDDAIVFYTNALEYGLLVKSERYDALYERAVCYYNINEYDNAENDILKALAINPNNVSALNISAAILIKNKKYDDALTILHKMESVKSTPSILYQIAGLYFVKKDDKSFEYFEKLFNMRGTIPKNDVVVYHKGFLLLAENYYSKDNFKKSAEVFTVVPIESRSYIQNIMNAKSLLNTNQFTKATELLEKINLKAEDKPLLCKGYIKTNNNDKAKNLMSAILMKNSELKDSIIKDPDLSILVQQIEKEKEEKQKTQNTLKPIPTTENIQAVPKTENKNNKTDKPVDKSEPAAVIKDPENVKKVENPEKIENKENTEIKKTIPDKPDTVEPANEKKGN